MNNQLKLPDTLEWYRIIIDDPELAKSASFQKILRIIGKHISANVVKTTNIEIVSAILPSWAVAKKTATILPLEELFFNLASITQVVWGRFFLFENKRFAEDSGTDLNQSIASSVTTVCVVDNSSYFIFTKSLHLVHEFLNQNSRLEIIKGDLASILARKEEF